MSETNPAPVSRPVDELEAAIRGLDTVVRAANDLAQYCAGPMQFKASLGTASEGKDAVTPDLRARIAQAVRDVDRLRSELSAYIEHISSAL